MPASLVLSVFVVAVALGAEPKAADPVASDPKPASPDGPVPAGRSSPKPAHEAGPAAKPVAEPPAVAWPHPLITEVLFAVPTGEGGDANQDGKRAVSGDEFVELVNPHDRAIQLRGCVITDGAAAGKSQLRFVFPAFELPAHGVVVLFNGHDSKIPGPVGDAKAAPAGPSAKFGGAYVFAVRPASSRASFSNAGDAACLRSADGKAVQRVRWGKADEKAGGTGFALDELAPTTTKGSVARDGLAKSSEWRAHADIGVGAFSPGTPPPKPEPAAQPSAGAGPEPATASSPAP